MSSCIQHCVRCNWLWRFGNTAVQSAMDSPPQKTYVSWPEYLQKSGIVHSWRNKYWQNTDEQPNSRHVQMVCNYWLQGRLRTCVINNEFGCFNAHKSIIERIIWEVKSCVGERLVTCILNSVCMLISSDRWQLWCGGNLSVNIRIQWGKCVAWWL